MNGKDLPSSFEAEKSILYCVLIDNQKINDVMSKITEDDFNFSANIALFKAMKLLYSQNKPLELVAVSNLIKSHPEISKDVNYEYVISLLDTIASPANIDYYITIVKEKSVLRKSIITLTSLTTEALQQPDDLSKYLQKVQQKIFDLSMNQTKTEVVSFDVALKEYFKELKEMAQNKSSITGVSTGFFKLDEFTGGLQPSDLIILAARPSMGKTSFALNIATNAAKKGSKVAIFSLEMPIKQLVNRIVSSEASINSSKLRMGKIKGDEWTKVTDAVTKLVTRKIFIDETPSISIPELASKSRVLKMKEGLDMILIDYLQLMKASSDLGSRELEISEISRSLKALAKELQIPVVALSQLNRSLEKRTDKRPILSDLRESGAIEQDADVIMFIYRGEVYNDKDAVENTAEIIIGKNRNGATGDFLTVFQKDFTRFDNIMDDQGDDKI